MIMIVDDSEDVREMFAIYLRQAGYETLEASDGQAALDALQRDQLPVAILMDVAMPGMDGAEATRRLKSEPAWSGIPVIAVTGQGQTGVDAMLDAQCDAVCRKPCFPEDVIEVIDRVRRDQL
jgi:CheY-like chemotaxis protein